MMGRGISRVGGWMRGGTGCAGRSCGEGGGEEGPSDPRAGRSCRGWGMRRDGASGSWGGILLGGEGKEGHGERWGKDLTGDGVEVRRHTASSGRAFHRGGE